MHKHERKKKKHFPFFVLVLISLVLCLFHIRKLAFKQAQARVLECYQLRSCFPCDVTRTVHAYVVRVNILVLVLVFTFVLISKVRTTPKRAT